MKKIVLITVSIFLLYGLVCEVGAEEDMLNKLETDEATSIMVEEMAEYFYEEKNYNMALFVYYRAIEKDIIDREKVIDDVNKVRNAGVVFPIVASSKDQEIPNMFLEPEVIDVGPAYDVFSITLTNNTDESFEINPVLTNFIAIDERGNSVEAYTPDDNSRTINSLRDGMIYDEEIHPGEEVFGILVFPSQNNYKGMYIDSLIHPVVEREEIYIDFLDY